MAVEGHLLRIRRSLEEKLGVEEAAYVIEGQPPGGWGSLVTKEHLDLRLGALEERIEGLEERFDLRLGALEEGAPGCVRARSRSASRGSRSAPPCAWRRSSTA